MDAFECKQEYTFTIRAESDKDAMDTLEKFHEEEDKIVYRPQSRIKIDRSRRFTLTRIDKGKP
jgi:hypothetical protein